MKTIPCILQENNINVSNKRIKILEYLLSQKKHFTIDDLYNDLKGEVESLSKTTIYNNVEVLLEKGLVSKISNNQGENIYDSNITNHSHFICVSCGFVDDINNDDHNINYNLINEKYRLLSKDVTYYGFCDNCK